MEVMSLEEDDYKSLFITQSDKVLNNDNVGISQESAKSDVMDYGLLAQAEGELPVYSDISDAEDFDIPSSQMNNKKER